jgi:hypothetical protein
LHFITILWYYATLHSNGLILGKLVIIRVYYGALIVSFGLGLVYYLLFDKPIRNLDRMVLFPTKISDSFLIKKSNTKSAPPTKSNNKSSSIFKKDRKSVHFASTSQNIGGYGGKFMYKPATPSVMLDNNIDPGSDGSM